MSYVTQLCNQRLAAYCEHRGLSSVHFERTVLEHALRHISLRRVAGRASPPLRTRVLGLVSERARAEVVLWWRLRDYLTWSVTQTL